MQNRSLIMLFRSILSAATVATALTGFTFTAHAADLVGEEAPIPEAVAIQTTPSARWSGFYAGVNTGYGLNAFGTPGGNIRADGLQLGGYAGVNQQTDNIVYGFEGDANYSFGKGSAAATSVKQGTNGALRARLGYDLDPVLIYGAGGVAAARGTISDGTVTDRKTHVGYTLGAGAEAFLTQNVIGRVEYRYNKFNSRTYDLTAPVKSNLTNNEVRFGVGMKF
jgi:outer membrane immunogenic protein